MSDSFALTAVILFIMGAGLFSLATADIEDLPKLLVLIALLSWGIAIGFGICALILKG
jgi:hypothetical protein